MIIKTKNKVYKVLGVEAEELINKIISDPTKTLIINKGLGYKNIPDVGCDDIVMSYVAKCEKNFGFEKGGLVTKINNDKMQTVPRSKEFIELILKLGQSAIRKLKLKDQK